MESLLRKAIKIFLTDRQYFFRASLRKIKSKFLLDYFLFRDGFSFYPTTLHFEITHYCNLHCFMCDLYSGKREVNSLRSKLESAPLDLASYERILSEIKKFNPLVNLVGGEPFLYRELEGLLKLIKKYDLDVSLTTNGVLLSKFAHLLVKVGVDSLILSLDGPAPIHNSLRGKEGVFEQVFRGLEKLLKLRRENRVLKPRVKIAPCITSKNYTYLYEFLESIKDLDIEGVTISHLWFWTEEMVKNQRRIEELSEFKIEPQNEGSAFEIDPDILSNQIHKIKKSRYSFPVNFFPDLSPEKIKDYYKDPGRIIKKRCFSAWREAIILPEGEVIPCLDYIFGDLKRANFVKIWNSSRAKNFRRFLRKYRVFPSCRRCCGLFIY